MFEHTFDVPSPPFRSVSPQVDTVNAAIVACDAPGRAALRTWLTRLDAGGRPGEEGPRRDRWVQGTIALIVAMAPPDRLLVRRWALAWIREDGTLGSAAGRSTYCYPPPIDFEKPR